MIIKFEMDNCPGCRQLSAMMKKLGVEPDQTILIDQSNIEEAKKYQVCSFPTLLKIENDTEVERFSGVPSFDKLRKLFNVPVN